MMLKIFDYIYEWCEWCFAVLYSVYVQQFKLSKTIQDLLAVRLRDFLVVVLFVCLLLFY